MVWLSEIMIMRKVKNGSNGGLSDQLILIQQELDMVSNNYYVSVALRREVQSVKDGEIF